MIPATFSRRTPSLSTICFASSLPTLSTTPWATSTTYSSLPKFALVSARFPARRSSTLPCGEPVTPFSPDRPSRQAPSMLIPPGNLPRRLPQPIETFLLINVVPFLWGSYAPVAKLLTSVDNPMPLSLANLLTTAAAAFGLSSMRYLQPSPESKKASFSNSAELGGYIFLGAWLHLRSVALTTASRSAFFIQFSTVFVPLLEFFSGKKVSPAVIPACLLTLIGAVCLVLPSDVGFTANAVSTIFASFNPGDIVAIAAALSYSVYIVRLDVLTSRAGSALPLAEGQIQGQLAFAAAWEMILALSGDSTVPTYFQHAFSMSPQDIVLTVLGIIWIGVFTNAFSTWAQIVGQQRVGASKAAIFYASQPVWAAGLSVAIGLDALSSNEIIGGALIIAGSLLLAAVDFSKSKSQQSSE